MKLEEAEFFLDFAEKVQDDTKVFGYYINAFFAAAASIRDGGGVMHYEYQGNPKFKIWFDSAGKNLHANFPNDFWVKKTRHEIIHREGNIEGAFRRQVTTGLRLETNSKNGSMSVRRDDPPADNRLRFAKPFDTKEGGKVIVDRCRDYLDALKLMVKDWEDNYLKSP